MKTSKKVKSWKLTSLFKDATAEPRLSGSIARRFSNKGREEGGKSLKVSTVDRLYGCCGLKRVAFGNRDLFQYSSDGEPHNLNILCSCSTFKKKKISKDYNSIQLMFEKIIA